MSGMGDLKIQIDEAASALSCGNEGLKEYLAAGIETLFEAWWIVDGRELPEGVSTLNGCFHMEMK